MHVMVINVIPTFQAADRDNLTTISMRRFLDHEPVQWLHNGKYNTPSSVACEHLDNCLPQTSQDLILKPVRVATSRSARQTYLNSLLFMIASSILFGLAIVAYIIFYIEYIPQIGIERVVHLQYGFVDSPRPGYAQEHGG